MNELQGVKILVIDQDQEWTGECLYYLEQWGYQAEACSSHLAALSKLEDGFFDLIVASVEQTDINGFEFCSLVRRRERDFELGKKYVILIGEHNYLSELTSANCLADDFLLRPFLWSELQWRLKNGCKQLAVVDSLRNCLDQEDGDLVLTKEGLESYLRKEINRLLRNGGQLALLLLQVCSGNMEDFGYGPQSKNWIEQFLVLEIKKGLRNYDLLSKLEQGVFCLYVPDASLDTLKLLALRLDKEFGRIFESLAVGSMFTLSYRGLLVDFALDYRQQNKALEALETWLSKALVKGQEESLLLEKGRIGEYGLEILEVQSIN